MLQACSMLALGCKQCELCRTALLVFDEWWVLCTPQHAFIQTLLGPAV